jgi:DHA2 family multidrug resistance protein
VSELSLPNLVVKNKGLLTAALMLATVTQVLDTTIANVALPAMRSALGASQDEINWVLTSYIVAAAIATPLTGWFADRFGRRMMLLVSIVGFTLASVMCGLSTSLMQIVLFRVLQGLFGAMIAPLAQSLMLDINPREKMGQAMAMFGAGIMVAPIVGPSLGSWLTDSFSWRWVFLINLPVGALAFAALFASMPKTAPKFRHFDVFGFAMLAIALACIQMLMDRGQLVDWFAAPEIWIYLGVAVSCIWAFIVHCATAESPFIDLTMFKDRNFSTGLIFIFMIGITTFSGMALLPPLLQSLMGYTVIQTGLIMAPRGVGTLISMILVGRLVGKVDPRLLVLFGILTSASSLWMMTGFDIVMTDTPIMVSGLLQGIGLGFVFVPLNTLAFATIPAHLRVDASSLFSVVRNVGSGVGISLVTAVLAHMSQVNHAELAERITLNSGPIRNLPGVLQGSPSIINSLNGLITQQSTMIAFLDDFFLMAIVTLASLPLIFLLRKPKAAAKIDLTHAMAE